MIILNDDDDNNNNNKVTEWLRWSRFLRRTLHLRVAKRIAAPSPHIA
jgi:hypothetical protein